MDYTRADYPMELVPKMESEKIPTTRGIRCWVKLLFLLPGQILYIVQNMCVHK